VPRPVNVDIIREKRLAEALRPLWTNNEVRVLPETDTLPLGVACPRNAILANAKSAPGVLVIISALARIEVIVRAEIDVIPLGLAWPRVIICAKAMSAAAALDRNGALATSVVIVRVNNDVVPLRIARAVSTETVRR
jgi:hypothetical protein